MASATLSHLMAVTLIYAIIPTQFFYVNTISADEFRVLPTGWGQL